jgi:hypothetical protein
MYAQWVCHKKKPLKIAFWLEQSEKRLTLATGSVANLIRFASESAEPAENV